MKIGFPLAFESKSYIYPKTFYKEIFGTPTTQELFKNKALFVTLNNTDPELIVDQICGVITYYNLKDHMITVEILDTPSGKILESLLDISEFELVPIGAGYTTKKKDKQRRPKVQAKDYELFRFDLRLKHNNMEVCWNRQTT